MVFSIWREIWESCQGSWWELLDVLEEQPVSFMNDFKHIWAEAHPETRFFYLYVPFAMWIKAVTVLSMLMLLLQLALSAINSSELILHMKYRGGRIKSEQFRCYETRKAMIADLGVVCFEAVFPLLKVTQLIIILCYIFTDRTADGADFPAFWDVGVVVYTIAGILFAEKIFNIVRLRYSDDEWGRRLKLGSGRWNHWHLHKFFRYLDIGEEGHPDFRLVTRTVTTIGGAQIYSKVPAWGTFRFHSAGVNPYDTPGKIKYRASDLDDKLDPIAIHLSPYAIERTRLKQLKEVWPDVDDDEFHDLVEQIYPASYYNRWYKERPPAPEEPFVPTDIYGRPIEYKPLTDWQYTKRACSDVYWWWKKRKAKRVPRRIVDPTLFENQWRFAEDVVAPTTRAGLRAAQERQNEMEKANEEYARRFKERRRREAEQRLGIKPKPRFRANAPLPPGAPNFVLPEMKEKEEEELRKTEELIEREIERIEDEKHRLRYPDDHNMRHRDGSPIGLFDYRHPCNLPWLGPWFHKRTGSFNWRRFLWFINPAEDGTSFDHYGDAKWYAMTPKERREKDRREREKRRGRR